METIFCGRTLYVPSTPALNKPKFISCRLQKAHGGQCIWSSTALLRKLGEEALQLWHSLPSPSCFCLWLPGKINDEWWARKQCHFKRIKHTKQLLSNGDGKISLQWDLLLLMFYLLWLPHIWRELCKLWCEIQRAGNVFTCLLLLLLLHMWPVPLCLSPWLFPVNTSHFPSVSETFPSVSLQFTTAHFPPLCLSSKSTILYGRTRNSPGQAKTHPLI